VRLNSLIEAVLTFVISIIVRSLLSFRCQHKMSTLPICECQTNKLTGLWLTKTQQQPNISIHQRTNSRTYQLTGSQAHRHTIASTHDYIHSQAHQLTNSSTHKLIHSRVHPFISSSTHKISNPQKLKFLSLSLQSHSNFRSILAKI